MYYTGDKVMTPLGMGVVVSVRRAPPTYSTVAAYYVILESKKYDANYNGTVFSAADVKSAN